MHVLPSSLLSELPYRSPSLLPVVKLIFSFGSHTPSHPQTYGWGAVLPSSLVTVQRYDLKSFSGFILLFSLLKGESRPSIAFLTWLWGTHTHSIPELFCSIIFIPNMLAYILGSGQFLPVLSMWLILPDPSHLD